MHSQLERVRNGAPAAWRVEASLPPHLFSLKCAPVFIGAWLLAMQAPSLGATEGLASKYPDDAGLAQDPAVLFAENFESGDLRQWDQKRGGVTMTEEQPNSGRWCAQMWMQRGKNTGGDAIKWFLPGADVVYARFYVKFSPDYQYGHHFVWLGANQRLNSRPCGSMENGSVNSPASAGATTWI